MPSEFLRKMKALLEYAEKLEVDTEAERGSGLTFEKMLAAGTIPQEIIEARAALAEACAPNGPGVLEVGVDLKGDVLINLPRDMAGHLAFSPNQASELAETLLKQAAKARHQRVGTLQFIPPPKECCQLCAHKHEADKPHNLQSLFYAMRFQSAHGREPTWADAIAHCSPAVQTFWRESLTKMNHWSEPAENVPPIAEPCV